MSVLYPLIQALVLFAVAPLLSGITRVARARLHNRRGPGVLQEYRDIIKLLGRQSVGPDASGWVFRLTPYVMVGAFGVLAFAGISSGRLPENSIAPNGQAMPHSLQLTHRLSFNCTAPSTRVMALTGQTTAQGASSQW
jgi:NADH:ubiquinone oxidoreductase subunit H